jgi:hypothetical protein
MWSNILNKITHLKSLDLNLVAHGAQLHQYSFNPPATLAEVELAEKRLQTRLPDELRNVYLNIGNGGPGPDFGLRPLDKLESRHAHEPFQGIQYVKSAEYAPDKVHGLITIIDRYSHYSCVICNGPDEGKIFGVDSEGIDGIDGDDLASVFTIWLDEEIAQFSYYAQAIKSSVNIHEILFEKYTKQGMHPLNSLQIIASLLGWTEFNGSVIDSSILWDGEGHDFAIAPPILSELTRRIHKYAFP